ncbi:MAG: leucyl/phenylalanyl-tRNA--protein transferase [bacterium]
MTALTFPPVEMADESGLLAVGGQLDVANLETAYRSGIFPWPVEGYPVLWFAPPKRAILEFSELRVSERLRRYLRKSNFSFRVDADFEGVIRACANSSNRKSQTGTWITEDMIRGYIEFHKAGFAHSFETVDADNQLIGGLYGVLMDNYFAGESMFFKEANASKFALIQTVQHLQGLGLSWMDVQVMTPLLKSFGAREIHREHFMQKMKEALLAWKT